MRTLGRLAIVLCAALHVAVVGVLLGGMPADTRVVATRIEHTTQIAVVPLIAPIVVPAPAVAPAAVCPAPATAAPPFVPRALPGDLAPIGVHASATNARWLAVWDAQTILVSTDGGATFERVLDGDGAVRDVGFDCTGRVIAVRASGIGVRDGARETWREAPGLQLADGEAVDDMPAVASKAWVIGDGPDVVVAAYRRGDTIGDARLRVAVARGDAWRYHEVDTYFEGAYLTGRQRPTGDIALELEYTDCDIDELVTVRITEASMTMRTEPAEAFYAWLRRIPRGTSRDAAGRRWTVACGALELVDGDHPPSCAGDNE